ncbi:DUF421 domain-containing protein [Paenibacillus marinisediminis]
MEDWIYVILRTWLAMVILYIMTKLLGKRQVSQLSLFEYMTGLTIGSVVVYITVNPDGKWVLGIISLIVWVLTSVGISWMQLKSKRFRDWVDGKSTIIIQNGKIMEQNMRKERLTIDEMMAQLRTRNAFRVSDVEFAVMEPSGEINVMLKKNLQPLTLDHIHSQLGDRDEDESFLLSSIVLMDGNILEDELIRIGKSRAWLEAELTKRGLRTEEVFVVEVNDQDQLHIDLYNQASSGVGEQSVKSKSD